MNKIGAFGQIGQVAPTASARQPLRSTFTDDGAILERVEPAPRLSPPRIARLQELAAPNTLAVGPLTQTLIEGQVAVRRVASSSGLGLYALKGY